jgi:predicted dehydrogenase
VTARRAIGIGLLGVGWMGEVHTSSYLRLRRHFPQLAADARLVVAADEVEERARLAAERLGYERWTTDWREVVDDPEVEAVSIAAPNALHEEMAVAAAQAGKHFWAEKPVGRFPAETARIAAAAEEAGIRTLVGLCYRQVPAVAHAKELIASGELGEINHYRAHFLAGYASHPQGVLSWRFRRDDAGLGVLGDLMSHAVDLSQHLLGPIRRVTARSTTHIRERPKMETGVGTHFSVAEGGELGEVENEDWVGGLTEFESGLVGILEASRVVIGPDARYVFEANGTRGAVAWDFERMNELGVHLPLTSGDTGYTRVVIGPRHPNFAAFQPGTGIPMGFDDLKVIEAYLFLSSVLDGEQREPGVREMLAAAQVLDAMQRSFESGAWEEVLR